MKKYSFKLLSLLLVLATLSLTVSCNFGDILEDIAPDDLGNGVENSASGDVQFTLEATEPSPENTYPESTSPSNKDTFEQTETEIPEKTFPTVDSGLGALDFGGNKLTVITLDSSSNIREWYKHSPEDEIDKYVAIRNSLARSELNINMMVEIVPAGNYNIIQNLIFTDITQDFHYYDISAAPIRVNAATAIRDCVAILSDEALFPYFDFDLPCWNQSIIENITKNHKLYYVAGDLNLSVFDAATVVWHNVNLYDRFKEDTDPESMLDLALAGQWTYDELYRWASRFYKNSNGFQGKQKDDTFALMLNIEDLGNIDAFTAAWDIEFISTLSDGKHFFNIDEAKTSSAIDKIQALFNATGTWTDADAEYFASSHSVFYISPLYSSKEVNDQIRGMKYRYGLMPMPKYDVAQENYSTISQESCNVMSALEHRHSTVRTKGEEISAYLQFMTEYSYSKIKPMYFNEVVKPFPHSDEDSAEMVKSAALFGLITSNIRFDFSYVYSGQLNNFNDLWRSSVVNDSSFHTEFTSNRSAYEKELTRLDAWFGLVSLYQ
ncbi:MAG: hypothetical protein E7642_00520 [Ruminococcaceae bacterium]|nr:hypothetical protein [Oscillospiraceae bacterium]